MLGVSDDEEGSKSGCGRSGEYRVPFGSGGGGAGPTGVERFPRLEME